jgi:hypothetical protein
VFCWPWKGWRLRPEEGFEVSWREALGLYLALQEGETGSDPTLRRLLDRLERALCQRLTIEEFEHLGELYRRSN